MRRLAIATFLLAAACGDHRRSYSLPTQTIVVHPGREFELALKSNQSTGYQWVLVDSAALGPLQLVSRDYSVPAKYRHRNGAGGTERWLFRARSPGTTVVSLIYKRPWESQPPADSARFSVTVR